MTTTTQNTESNRGRVSENSLANLRPFQLGQSGNPGGRPKRKPITDAIAEVIAETNPRTKKQLAREVAEALIKKAKRGDVKAAALVLDRLEGKVADRLEGEIAGKITVEIVDVAGS